MGRTVGLHIDIKFYYTQGLITEKARKARASPLKFQRGPEMTDKLYLQFPLFLKKGKKNTHLTFKKSNCFSYNLQMLFKQKTNRVL